MTASGNLSIFLFFSTWKDLQCVQVFTFRDYCLSALKVCWQMENNYPRNYHELPGIQICRTLGKMSQTGFDVVMTRLTPHLSGLFFVFLFSVPLGGQRWSGKRLLLNNFAERVCHGVTMKTFHRTVISQEDIPKKSAKITRSPSTLHLVDWLQGVFSAKWTNPCRGEANVHVEKEAQTVLGDQEVLESCTLTQNFFHKSSLACWPLNEFHLACMEPKKRTMRVQ